MPVLAEEEQEDTKCILKAKEEDHFYLGLDQAKCRVVVHIAASPTRTNYEKMDSDYDGSRKARLRMNEKVFESLEEAEGYLDGFRAQEPRNYH